MKSMYRPHWRRHAAPFPARLALACLVLGASTSWAQSGPGSAASATEAQLRAGSADAFRDAVPPEMLEQEGDVTNQRLLQAARAAHLLLPADDRRVRRARAILQRLVPYAYKWNDRARTWHWDVNVVQSPNIDAVALPGGKIVLYSGMIDRLSLRDDELALLLAHLSTHALREHARGRLAQAAHGKLDNQRLSRLFGLRPGVSLDPLGDRLLSLRYGPADETEADVIGADIASRAGFDPRAAVNFWQKVALANRAHPLEFAQAHPYTLAREHALKKRLNDMLPLFAKTLGTSVAALPPFPLPNRERLGSGR